MYQNIRIISKCPNDHHLPQLEILQKLDILLVLNRMILPYFQSMVLEATTINYGWQVAFIFCSGLSMQICVLGSTFFPLRVNSATTVDGKFHHTQKCKMKGKEIPYNNSVRILAEYSETPATIEKCQTTLDIDRHLDR